MTGIGRGAVERHGEIADGGGAREVDAELVGDVAADFGHGDLQHDLLRPDDLDQAALALGIGNGIGHGLGIGLVLGSAHRTGQHEMDLVIDRIVGERFHADIGAGDDARQGGLKRPPGLQRRQHDIDVEHADGAARIVDEDDVGGAFLDALHDGPCAAAHNGGGYVGLGDDDFGDAGGQVDDHRLVQFHLDLADRAIGGAGNGDLGLSLRLRLGGDDGRRRDQQDRKTGGKGGAEHRADCALAGHVHPHLAPIAAGPGAHRAPPGSGCCRAGPLPRWNRSGPGPRRRSPP